jgi:hypothetical protein
LAIHNQPTIVKLIDLDIFGWKLQHGLWWDGAMYQRSLVLKLPNILRKNFHVTHKKTWPDNTNALARLPLH